MAFPNPILFTDAVASLRARSPLAASLTSAEWTAAPVAIRLRSQFSARIENVRFLTRLQSVLDDYLTGARNPNGTLRIANRAHFIQEIRRFALKEGMGPLDPADAGTIKDITSERRLGLIFDIQIQSAQAYGQWLQSMDPESLAEYPAFRFIRAADVTTPRKRHEENEGAVRLKTDLPFWLRMNAREIGGFEVPWGPWGFNSGMEVEEVDREEAVALGLLTHDQVLTPIIQDFNAHVESSAKSLDPEYIAWLKSKLGAAIQVDGDSIKLVAPGRLPAPPPTVLPPAIPTPPPAAPAAPATPPASPITSAPAVPAVPVSKALQLPATGKMAKAAKRALEIIDQVHGDGTLPTIPMKASRSQSFGGLFRFERRSTPVSIELSSASSNPVFTMIHEVGHFLDLSGLSVPAGTSPTFSSLVPSELSPVLSALLQTPTIQSLKEGLSKAESRLRYHITYLLKPQEVWARAYQQFVATRSRDPDLLATMNEARRNDPAQRFWADEEFAPVAELITALFKSKGWL